jgi:hypothetical protein
MNGRGERVAADALLRELSKRCKKNVVEYVLQPMAERNLTRGGLRLGNLVVEVGGVGGLHQRMKELMSTAPWLDVVYRIVTNGTEAEYYVLRRGGEPELKARGSLAEVAAAAASDLCADKIPVVSPEDIATIFGA